MDTERDLTKLFCTINSEAFASPPTDFRRGHVSPRGLSPECLEVRADGFRVKMPSGTPIPTPTVHGARLYTGGGFHSKEFYCFDALSGNLIWGVDLDDDGPSAPVVEDGFVVFNTESCTLFVLNAETGEQVWSWWLGDPLMSSPAVANGRVFSCYPNTDFRVVGHGTAPGLEIHPTHVLAAFDLKSGKILWQRWIDSDVLSAPVADGDRLLVTTLGGNVYTFAQEDGDIRTVRGVRATSAPVVAGNEIHFTKRVDQEAEMEAKECVSSSDRAFRMKSSMRHTKSAAYLDARVQRTTRHSSRSMSLDAMNGFVSGAPASANTASAFGHLGYQSVSSLQSFQGSRVLHYEGWNYSAMGDELICARPDSEDKLWTIKLRGDLAQEGGFLASPPVMAGDRIFLSTLEGEVLRIVPQSGVIEKRYAIGEPLRWQPIVAGGRIYVSSETGSLFCIETGNGDFTGWSCWGADAAHTGNTSVVVAGGS